MNYRSSKEERFESIYRAYADDILKVALHHTKDEYVAQEITQKTFIQFYKHFEDEEIECIRAYLICSAKRLAYNWYRDTKHERESEDVDMLDYSGDEHARTISVEDAYILKEHSEDCKDLRKGIFAKLYEKNVDWYNAMMLVYCMEKSVEQVTEELGISSDVLYSRLYRAKKWIRKNYAEEYKEIREWS